MSYLEWSDHMSVHVGEIDAEHKGLVAVVNRLGEAMLSRRGPREQKDAIAAMLAYATRHFGHEEQYMKAFGFGGYDAHKAEHDAFIAKARELRDRYDRGGFILTLEIVDFLKAWLTDHIMGTDQRYTEVFQEHGLR
jgi:hemerythrin